MRIRVDRVAPEGEGIGKIEGPGAPAGRSDKIVFVPHGVPGDLIEVELFQE